ncbi:MAG: ribonuclease P protein component [Coriobacteriia bacterium]|nr:ribonuclease P protein component [Coriobacteriia bacterium]
MRTITAATDVDRLFREGARAARHNIVVLSTPTRESRDPSKGRVIFIAGKKLGGAVQRNRSKRVLRAACRRLGGPWAGFDVALISRASTASVVAKGLDEDLTAALRKLEIIS